jgi:hypothetical protein
LLNTNSIGGRRKVSEQLNIRSTFLADLPI